MARMGKDDRGADQHAGALGDQHIRPRVGEMMPPLPRAHAVRLEHGILDLDEPRKIGIARAADAEFFGAGGTAFGHGRRA